MNKEILIKAGIDYDDGMHRFCGNSAMYEKYLVKLTALPLMDDLKAAMQAEQYADAFKICHKLKAFVGNLSIPVVYETICELTEILRPKQVDSELAKKVFAHTYDLYSNVIAVITKEESHE